GPGVAIAVLEHAVLVDRGRRRIGHADHMNPLSSLYRLLKIAADAFPTRLVEHIEANATGARRDIGRVLVVHPEHPFMLAGLALAHPVHIAGALEYGKGRDVRTDPCRHAQLTGG